MATYLVFGRTSYPQPLEHRGTLEAPDPETAARQAHRRFGEGWVELVLVPAEQVYWVLRSVAGERVVGAVE